MKNVILPAIWLIVLIVGLPQLSETIYTPSLPDIAKDLMTSESSVEFTLTIYLFGFSVGTLFWGKLSDKFGRKSCVLWGLFVFILGCIGCYFSQSISALMFSRFIQAFGGSIGSVLGQAICRDAFHGPALGRVYSTVGSSLALFPAVGPIIGGVIAEHWGWSNIFLCLIAFSVVLSVLIFYLLPETHHKESRQPIVMKDVALALLRDKKVIGLGLIVAASNGISFSYYAEGSFYLIQLLGLSPSQYGLSFVLLALSTMMGGLTSKRLHTRYNSHDIMEHGLIIICLATVVFSIFAFLHHKLFLSSHGMIGITIVMQMLIMFGICMATSNALAMALVDYKWCIGTASSLFGFFYYCVISLFTFGMGVLHNGTTLPMPLYFLGISLFMIFLKKWIR